jgi:hypothetical protein
VEFFVSFLGMIRVLVVMGFSSCEGFYRFGVAKSIIKSYDGCNKN